MSRKLFAFIGIAAAVAIAIALVVMQNTSRTISQQPAGANQNGQTSQDQSQTPSTPIDGSTSGMYGDNGSILPKQAFDANPYP